MKFFCHSPFQNKIVNKIKNDQILSILSHFVIGSDQGHMKTIKLHHSPSLRTHSTEVLSFKL